MVRKETRRLSSVTLLQKKISRLSEKISRLEEEISNRNKAVAALRESQERYQALFDRSLLCVFVNDSRGKFIDANQAALDLLGYTKEEISGLTFSSLLDQSQLPKAFRIFDEIIKTGSQKRPAEYKLRRKDGNSVWVETEASLIFPEGEAPAIQGIARDITDRKRAEEDLKASLKEKEALLREIHHRVKNNLQVISSLLDMRAMRTADKKIVDLCKDARAKIQTMALIHTHIYQSDTFTQIAMKDYVRDLVNFLTQVYSEKRRHVAIIVEEADVYLSVTQAMPFAIILNEAISNAFKHAFKKGQKGTIRISLKETGENTVSLKIKDDGVGFPEGIDIHNAQTLGLKLMRNLVRDQLKGQIKVEKNRGTEVIVEFKPLNEEGKDEKNIGC